MIRRVMQLPVVVLNDTERKESRCVNGLHVQTFIPNPHWNGEHPRGTLITFTSGDTVTVAEDFDVIVEMFMAAQEDG